MKKIAILIVIKILARLPLSAIRYLGRLVGRVSLRFSKKSAQRLPQNLLLTGVATPDTVKQMTKRCAESLGMTMLESILIAWQKDKARINKLFKIDESRAYLEILLAEGKNIVFLTPHLGNFEMAVKYFTYNLPIDLQIMYKKSKNPLFEEIIFDGRRESNILPVPTSRRGILSLMRHFESGGSIGILPDSVASEGNGCWVKFFGQDVYAATFAAKFAQNPNNHVMIVSAIRTENGFSSKVLPFIPKNTEIPAIVQELYYFMEELISQAPEQYYWSYDRFRNPDSAKQKFHNGKNVK